MPIPEWKLPRGVSRSLWEFAHDPQLVEREAEHLAGTSLLDLDRQLAERWFPASCSLVDLGCGTGRLLAAFAGRGFPVVGVDLSPDSLQAAQRNVCAAGATAGLVRANLCELDCLPAESFDGALLMFGTLGMVSGQDNRRALLGHAWRILRSGGRLALHAHNVWRHLAEPQSRAWLLKDRLKRLFGSKSAGDTFRDYRGIPGMYHHAFTRRELLGLLKTSGFRVCEIVPVPAFQDGSSRMSINRLIVSGWVVLAEKITQSRRPAPKN